MSSLNKVLLLGRLGSDPELRYTPNQTAICTMKIATNDRRRSPEGEWTEHTEWHTVVCFGKTAENCSQYLQKGRMAFVEGRIQTRKWQDQEGKDRYWTEIVANTVQFVGGKGEGAGDRPPMAARAAQNQQGNDVSFESPVGEPISFDDDDIPF